MTYVLLRFFPRQVARGFFILSFVTEEWGKYAYNYLCIHIVYLYVSSDTWAKPRGILNMEKIFFW